MTRHVFYISDGTAITAEVFRTRGTISISNGI